MNIKNKQYNETMKFFLNEANIHKKFNHPNIVKLHNVEVYNLKFYMILEYCKKGSLHDLLKRQNSLTFEKIKYYFKKICEGLQYLHSKKIIHRDLKLENILLTENNEPKISDFGWASSLKKVNKRTTFCGTYEYMAPEIFESEKYDFTVDIWSLGILLYELYHNKTPFYGTTAFVIYKNIINENINFREDIDLNAKNLILNILKVNPEKRLSLEEIIGHEFFKETIEKENDFNEDDFDFFLDRLNCKQFNHFEQTKKLTGNFEKENSFINLGDSMSIDKDNEKINIKNDDKVKGKKVSNLKNKKFKNKIHKKNISFEHQNKKFVDYDEKIFGIKTDRKNYKMKVNGIINKVENLLKITEKNEFDKSNFKLLKINSKKYLEKTKKNKNEKNILLKKKIKKNSFLLLEDNYKTNQKYYSNIIPKSNYKQNSTIQSSKKNSKKNLKNKTMIKKHNYSHSNHLDFKYNISNRDIKVGIYDKPFKKKKISNIIFTKIRLRKKKTKKIF